MVFWFLKGLTPVAYASVDTFVRKVNTIILNPLIKFLVYLAVAYFLFGVFEYLRGRNSEEARSKGQRHMMWSMIGLFVMVGVFFIMKVIMGTIGISEDEIDPRTGEVNIDQSTGTSGSSSSPFGG